MLHSNLQIFEKKGKECSWECLVNRTLDYRIMWYEWNNANTVVRHHRFVLRRMKSKISLHKRAIWSCSALPDSLSSMFVNETSASDINLCNSRQFKLGRIGLKQLFRVPNNRLSPYSNSIPAFLWHLSKTLWVQYGILKIMYRGLWKTEGSKPY